MFDRLDAWYKTIPPYGTDAFAKFLVNAGHFATYIAPGKPISVRIDNAALTALCDVKKREIVLPAWSFVPSTWQTVSNTFLKVHEKDYARASIACVTGNLIHEALHLRESALCPFDALVAATPEAAMLDPGSANCAISCLQLIEDLHNENVGRQQPYGFFIDNTNDFVFTDEALWKRQNAAMEHPTFGNMYNLLLCYKNPRHRSSVIWDKFFGSEVVSLLQESFETHDTVERAKLAMQLYKRLRAVQQEKEEERQTPASPSDTDVGNSTGRWDGSNNSIVAPDGEKLDRAGLKKFLDRVDDEINALLKETDIGNIDELAHEMTELTYPEGHKLRIPPIFVIDVDSPEYARISSCGGRNITPSPNFTNFGEILSLLRSKNWVPGPPMDHGRRIVSTRLHRIATDNKIFGIPEDRTTRDEREVIMCCDASGSMGHLYFLVLSAAYGALESLQRANIDTQVYAHTTTGNHAPLLLRIASNTSQFLNKRFFAASRITNRGTYDGEIIRYLGKQFSGRAGQKILIMLCDGEPNCIGYTGDLAIEDTKKAVRDLRQRGIVVLVLSLAYHIMDNNDNIYGKEFNVNATRNVETALRRTIEKAVL